MAWNSYAPLSPRTKSLPVISEDMRSAFRRLPYNATLSRHACGVRFAEAKKATVRGRGPVFSTGVTHCASCSVGAEHAKGIPADSAPSLPPPVAPLGHSPPQPVERVGRFVVDVAKRQVASAEERLARRAEQARERRAKAKGSAPRLTLAPKPAQERPPSPPKPVTVQPSGVVLCSRCGEKERASVKARYCADCRAETLAIDHQRRLDRNKRMYNYHRRPCRMCGKAKDTGSRTHYCAACKPKAEEERKRKHRANALAYWHRTGRKRRAA